MEQLLSAWADDAREQTTARSGRHSTWLSARRRRRNRIVVVTDSSCSLPLPRLAAADLRVVEVPIPVMIGEQIYPGAGQELHQDLALAVAQGLPVRTSRPSPGRLMETFRALEKEGVAGIVAVHLSKELSGTVDAARLAAEEVEVPVRVVDSRQTGFSLGHAVLDAAAAASRGATLEEVAGTAERTAAASESLFVVPNLEQLRRGGRINAAASLLGSLLWVKPLLGLRDGEVQLLERPRTMPRALERLQQRVRDAAGHMDRPRVVIHGFGNAGEAVALAEELADLSSAPVPVVDLPPALGAHLGLGALAVCVSPEPQPVL